MSLLLSCHTLSKSYGPRVLFEDISLGIFSNDKIGLIGPNGSGKSTFLKILTGLDNPDTGTVSPRRSLRIGYIPQISEYPHQSVEEVLIEEISDDNTKDDYQKHSEARIILGKVGFEDPLQMANSLSGGWKKRLDIAKALIKAPELLFLDEPTNHLDMEGIEWLSKFLKRESFAYMIVSHDRYFLQNATNRMIELNKSFPKGFFSVEGPYLDFLEKRDEFLKGQVQYERSLASKVRREIEWLRKSPKARTTKSQARVQEAQELIQEFSDVKVRNKTTVSQIDFSSTERQTKKLLTVHNLAKSIGEKTLFSHLSFVLSPGTRLGIVGPNGSGKTTLLKLLRNEVKPTQGTIKIAEGVSIVYFDQHRMQLPLDISLRLALAPNGDSVTYQGKTIHVNGWCRRFLFSPDLLELPIGQLSGGERARILIARLMLEPADILLLDEPTNDLDIPTLEILEESLEEFTGAIVLITHDRFMLEQISNVILGLGGSDDTYLFPDYFQWTEHLKKEKAKTPDQEEEKPPPRPKVPSKKLSYKEKCEYDQMEENILSAEQEIHTLQKRLEDPLISADSAKLQEACKILGEAQERLDKLYLRWQELEEKLKSP